MPRRDLAASASAILKRTWTVIRKLGEKGTLRDWVSDPQLKDDIRAAVNSSIKSYRYVLPTQIVAKLAHGSLDSRCLQASGGGRGAFDARTIAHKVVQVTYPAPRRISLEHTIQLVEKYLSQHSGGDRLLAVASALFVVMGRKFRLYSSVRRENITAADQATGMVADLERLSENEEIVLAVEVKDRQLTINQLRGKIASVRGKQISEIFFVAQQGIPQREKDEIAGLIEREFSSGQNVYVITDFIALARIVLALFGEDGRREFLTETANQLDSYRSEIGHRRAWAELLGAV